MPIKKDKAPLSGQKSIQSFFSPKFKVEKVAIINGAHATADETNKENGKQEPVKDLFMDAVIHKTASDAKKKNRNSNKRERVENIEKEIETPKVDVSRSIHRASTKSGTDCEGITTREKRKRKPSIIESDEESEKLDKNDSESEYCLSSSQEEESEDESMHSEYELSDDADMDESSECEENSKQEKIRKDGRKSSIQTPENGKYTVKTPSYVPKKQDLAIHSSRRGTAGLGVTSNGMIATPRTIFTTSTKQKDAASTLCQALERTPGATPGNARGNVSMLESTPGSYSKALDGEMAARFAARDAARFSFLLPENIRDAKKRRPTDPDYNPHTLYIPPDWFKKNKISEGQKQWWEFKAANWGSVLFFKVGKFYELFEMDAHIGSDVLGLTYMKGEQPHCGFPEANYSQMAERLARAGYRIVVVEQTETPEALAKRNEERRRSGLKKDTVVRREKVAVLSKSTLSDPEMTSTVADAQYLMSVVELFIEEDKEKNLARDMLLPSESVDDMESDREFLHSSKKVIIGAAAADVATGRLLIGQWCDDDLRTDLRAVVSALQPAEVLIPRDDSLSATSAKTLSGAPKTPILIQLPKGDEDGCFWSAKKVRRILINKSEYSFPSLKKEVSDVDIALEGEVSEGTVKDIPGPLQSLYMVDERVSADSCNDNTKEATAMALGGLLSYLKESLLDKQLLAAGTVEYLDEVVSIGNSAERNQKKNHTSEEGNGSYGLKYATLDGSALENLEILENTEGGISGTLLAALDHCTTPFGRRRLRKWLCRPLARPVDILNRQDAVEDLLGPAEEASGAARKSLSGVADLERVLTRLCATGAGFGPARDAPRVIIYEDVAKKRVKTFLHAVRSLEMVAEAIAAFQNIFDTLSSHLLKEIVSKIGDHGTFPELHTALSDIENAADWNTAEATGRVVPAPGVDKNYDEAEKALNNAESALDNYLNSIRKELKAGTSVRFVSLNKESHVIEAPEGVSVPHSWEAMQGKKGIKRYTNSKLRGLIADRESALLAKEVAQNEILQNILAKFASNRDLWMTAVDVTAELDALMSLAVAAASSDGPMTRPIILHPDDQRCKSDLSDAVRASPSFVAHGLRHPAGVMGAGGSFVPNDIHLGGDKPQFLVLTGPNMGGKSTLMRQVCLATVCAQVGAWVPAEYLEIVPVDALFVRMGARDRILSGQSTFFVEMSETAAALSRATSLSLVALDELGRGTATSDGEAIASAVLDYMASNIKCRGIFATHYHRIAESHASDPNVAISHMECVINPSSTPGGVDEVVFLYRLAQGACPKSYGVNVARLAGLPDQMLSRAAAVSENMEERWRNRSALGNHNEQFDRKKDGESDQAVIEKKNESLELIAEQILKAFHLKQSNTFPDLRQKVYKVLSNSN